MHIRSLLFCPANKKKLYVKALSCDADIVVFDLEDAVVKTDKPISREILSNWLNAQSKEIVRHVAVRINRINTEEGRLDMEMLQKLHNQPKLIVLPKTESVKQIQNITKLFHDKEIKTIPLIETVKGIENIREIMTQPDKIAYVMLGSADLSTDLNCDNNRFALQYANSKVLFACALHNIPVIDSPYFDIGNNNELEVDTQFGKSIGFSARAAIHPKQIITINQVYSYTKCQIEEAQKIVEASKKGVGVVNGQMIDEAMAKRAKRIIERTENKKI